MDNPENFLYTYGYIAIGAIRLRGKTGFEWQPPNTFTVSHIIQNPESLYYSATMKVLQAEALMEIIKDEKCPIKPEKGFKFYTATPERVKLKKEFVEFHFPFVLANHPDAVKYFDGIDIPKAIHTYYADLAKRITETRKNEPEDEIFRVRGRLITDEHQQISFLNFLAADRDKNNPEAGSSRS